MRAALVVAAAMLAAPAWGAGWALAVYLDGRSDLARDVAEHDALLRAGHGTLPLGLHIVTEDDAGRPRAVRWWRERADDGPGRTARVPAEASAGAEALADFVAWAAGLWPQRKLAVALMGHGLPADAGDTAHLSAPRLLAASAVEGLTADDIAAAMRAGLRRAERARIELLILETCYGASLEILGAAAGSFEYALAAPGEVPSPGLPWSAMLGAFTAGGDAPGGRMAAALARAATEAQAPGHLPWSLTACDLGRMGRVEAALGEMSKAALGDIASATAGAHWARNRALRGERLRHVCDAGELAYGTAAYARTPELARAARALRTALEDLVVERARLGPETEEGDKRLGVTVFVPSSLTDTVEGYVTASRVARSSGYGRFLEAYLQYCRSLLPGLRSETPPAGVGR